MDYIGLVAIEMEMMAKLSRTKSKGCLCDIHNKPEETDKLSILISLCVKAYSTIIPKTFGSLTFPSLWLFLPGLNIARRKPSLFRKNVICGHHIYWLLLFQMTMNVLSFLQHHE